MKRPSGLCSCIRLFRPSFVMTLEMYVELLLRRLVLGFLRFAPSLLANAVKSALSPPNAGAFSDSVGFMPWELVPLRWSSRESPEPFSLSLTLELSVLGLALPLLALYSRGDTLRGLTIHRDSFTPAVADVMVDARGLGLRRGPSCGCGGGVARCMLSRRT